MKKLIVPVLAVMILTISSSLRLFSVAPGCFDLYSLCMSNCAGSSWDDISSRAICEANCWNRMADCVNGG